MGRKRPFRPLRQAIEAGALRTLGWIARSLSFERASDLGAFVGRLAWRLLGRRRHIAIDNVTRALGPEPGGEPAEAIARRAVEQLGRTFVEFLALPAHSRESLLARIELTGFDPARPWVEKGKGAVFVTGHFGNWELLGAAVGWTYGPVHYVLPRQTNAASDAYLNGIRRDLGITCHAIEDGMLAPMRALKRGGLLGMLGDQDARKIGIHVPFFGRPASTLTGPARLAIAANVPIVIGMMERAGRGRFRAWVARILEPSPGADEHAEVERLTRDVNETLEDVIRARPDHWYWIHRRWKTPPPAPPPPAPPPAAADAALRRS
ncbi:MAG TPA: lysophospholipid acyltransferase family protein [Candidatus Eisenbacteria bacterium]|nr:lysophospholipid acyltransferase family protein [Candidatus Eisenbacteria bacterium]